MIRISILACRQRNWLHGPHRIKCFDFCLKISFCIGRVFSLYFFEIQRFNVYKYDKTKLIPIFVIYLLVGSSLGFYFAGFNGNNVSFPFWE